MINKLNSNNNDNNSNNDSTELKLYNIIIISNSLNFIFLSSLCIISIHLVEHRRSGRYVIIFFCYLYNGTIRFPSFVTMIIELVVNSSSVLNASSIAVRTSSSPVVRVVLSSTTVNLILVYVVVVDLSPKLAFTVCFFHVIVR